MLNAIVSKNSSLPDGNVSSQVTLCSNVRVLITSLFVFFTTTMSVSFTLRETQARMLKFTVQLPTYRLIFVHVVESLVFVPIMIGILFFLFEFFDDQLLAFMVLTLVWLCKLYTMISVRTPLSMQYFPRFFFLYFMVFHIYFLSYTYGFSYLTFSATGAFMQHLVLYFWNQFEVPALQNFLWRWALFQHQGLHISSAILQVAQLTNSSLLGDTENIGLNRISHRAGIPQDKIRNPENGRQHMDGRQENFMLHRSAARELGGGSQASVYPLSIRNLTSFSVDGDSGMYNSNQSQNGGLSSIITSPPDGLTSELEYWRRVSREEGQRGAGGIVSEQDNIRSAVGSMYRETTSEVQVSSSSEATHTGGPFSLPGSVLPWILGSGPGTVVSFLPIFRDVRDGHQELDTVVTPEQEAEERTMPRELSSETKLRQRSNATPH